jgi:hypothetical protein
MVFRQYFIKENVIFFSYKNGPGYEQMFWAVQASKANSLQLFLHNFQTCFWLLVFGRASSFQVKITWMSISLVRVLSKIWICRF